MSEPCTFKDRIFSFKESYKYMYFLSIGNAINSLRRLLRRTWATANNFICIQPLEQILYYFGAKTTIYFAWLGFYTQMLIPPAIFGVLVFLRGFFGFGGIGLIDDPVKGSKSGLIFALGKILLTW